LTAGDRIAPSTIFYFSPNFWAADFFAAVERFQPCEVRAMPKKSGEAMPPIKHQPPLRPPSRPLKRFDPPALGPHHRPPAATPSAPSNELAGAAVRIAGDKNRRINPKQQIF
jgi:hypothetical protein